MIPKSQHRNTLARQEFRSRSIANFASAIVVTTAIQFNCETRLGTIEIYDVTIDRMLPTEFVAAEFSIPQLAP